MVLPGRHLAPTPIPSQSRTSLSDESTLASISQILSSFASIAQTKSSSELPTTPTHSWNPTASSTILLPVTNTSSKLHRFLEYAETHLGIPNTQLYERCLEEMGYTPDILHLVDDSSLKDIGIKPGDVICLKQNSLQWLNSFALKSKKDDSASFTPSMPPNKWVRFEKRFLDGGSARVYGLRIVEAERDTSEDLPFNWFYFCEVREAGVPIPSGCIPVLEHDVEF